MQSMTNDEARKWCSQDALHLRVSRNNALRCGGSDQHKFFIAAPEEHRRIAYLASQILCFRGEAHFSGGLLWLQRWDIGSQIQTGWLLLESVRRAHGELRSLELAPAQIFREDEFVQAHAFLVQVIAFGWVADYVPSGDGFFLHFKDNRQICFSAESSETLKELRTAFQEWSPTDGDPMVVRMESIRRARPGK
jgi:hypothetical protein